MRLEEMKDNIPETPGFIHEIVQKEVEKQLCKTTKMPEKKKYRMGLQVAAAAGVCLLVTSTVAYAGNKLYQMYLEKQGTYSVSTGLRAEDTSDIRLPEKVHEISITSAYIPEGMEWTDEYHLQYADSKQSGGFSFASALLDDDDFTQVRNDKGVVESEERTFGKYNGVYLRYQDLAENGDFNQRIYLLCPDEYRVLTIYVGDDVSKEDAVKVAENLVLTEEATMVETAGLYTWSDEINPKQSASDEPVTKVSVDELSVYQIGEAVQLSADGEDTEGSYIEDIPVEAKVESVQIADDLGLLNGQIPEEWHNATDAGGKLTENKLSYIKDGDGVDSLDQIVRTKTEKQKLVYATVTYTNQSEQEIDHMLYIGSLMLLRETEGNYQAYDPREEAGDGYDHIIWDGAARIGEMVYRNLSDDYGDGGNYIPALKAGESVQVSMAWIVNESDLKDMYLNLNGDNIQFKAKTLASGIVDIRQR